MTITLDGTTGITSPNDTTGNQSYTGTLTGGTGVVNLGSGQFYKDASGNVGIGITNPTNILVVAGAATANADARATITSTDTTAFAAGVGGGITFKAKYNSAGAYFDAANIKGIKENGTDGNFAGAMVFVTAPNGSSPTERMRINSAGNLGIGNSDPTTRLNVLDTQWALNAGSPAVFIRQSSANGNNGLVVDVTNTVGQYVADFRIANNPVMRVNPSGILQFDSGFGSIGNAYGCRAWVNFNGTDTVAIRNSGNVSSITDAGTGSYNINYTTTMPDANYSIVSCGRDSGVAPVLTSNTATSAAAGFVNTLSTLGTNADANNISVAVFR